MTYPYDGGSQEPAVPEPPMWSGPYYDDGSQEPVNPWTGNESWTPPEGATTNTPNGGGGGGWGNFLQSLLGGAGNALGGMNLGGLAAFMPMYYASQRAANEHNEQAGRYEALGERAAQQADPWGNDRRRMFQGKLDDLLADPTKSPIYQSMERRAMQALGPRLAAAGQAGSDAGSRDWLETLGDVSNKYTGEWADRYGKWGGGDVDPGNASRFLMEGGKQAGDARNAALAARLMPMGALASLLNGGNRGGGGGGGGGSNPNGGGGIGDILRSILGNGRGGGDGGGGGINTPQGLISILNKLPLSSLSPEAFTQLGQGGGLGALFGGLTDSQREGIFGPGWEDFVTQNPDFGEGWDTGNFGDMPTFWGDDGQGGGFGFDLGDDFGSDWFADDWFS